MYVHVFVQMCRGYSDINLFHEWLRIFYIFMSAKHKWKYDKNPVSLVKKIPYSASKTLNFVFITFSLLYEHLGIACITWREVTITCYSHSVPITVCKDTSFIQWKNLVFLGWKCSKYGYLLYWRSLNMFTGSLGLGFCAKWVKF